MDPSAAGERRNLPFTNVNGKVSVFFLGVLKYDDVNLAVDFLENGCRVVLIGCPLALVTKAWNQSRNSAAYGSDWVKVVALDAGKGYEAVEEAVEEAWRAFAGIDILVNYALDSAGVVKSVMETNESDFDNFMTKNVKEVWSMTKAVAKKMQQGGKGGSILSLTSIAGTESGTFPGVSMYGTSMAAINHMTKLMAMELGKFGIRMNAIACGIEESSNYVDSAIKEPLDSLAKRVVPLQRWLHFTDDITGVALWLAGDYSTFITGTVICVDGGLSFRRPRMGEYRSLL